MSDLSEIAHRLRHAGLKAYILYGGHKSIGAFERQLWRAALDLFRGGDEFNFIDDYTSAIDNQLRRAWNEGAREMDIDPRDYTDGDIQVLEGIIENESNFILGLAEAILDYRAQEHTDKEFHSAFYSRVMLWVNRYNETRERAKQHFSAKGQKFEWVLGPTEEHCHTGDVPGKIGCANLAGIVLFATEWEQTGIEPGQADNPILACGGWRCECQKLPTTKRRTPDGLSKVLDMIAGAGL